MSESPLAQLVAAHERLAAANDQKLEPMTTEDLADFADRGWVRFPLSAAHVKELEDLTGFSFSPLLRGLLETRAAMPRASVDVFGIDSWCAESIFEKNKDVASAREEYDWDLPKLVAITSDEDFLAVTEDGNVVRVCSNEGNIEVDHGPLDRWLVRYAHAVEKKADGAESDEVWEDPEAQYV